MSSSAAAIRRWLTRVANLLFLAHRLPFPPNKGDKVRSYHWLKALAREHRVFLGTFIDNPEDEGFVDKLKHLCTEIHVARLHPRTAKLRSLRGLLTGEALTLPYYRDAGIHAWVKRTIAAHRIGTAIVFSSAMAQYIERTETLRVLVDFIDVDSAKWAQYAAVRPWPLSWIYRREARRLLAYERAVAGRSARSFFVTPGEAALFLSRAPECEAKVEAIGNGVDTDYFSPAISHASPYPQNEVPLVFTGAMDYWPNVDAVQWFASEVMPQLKLRWPRARLYVVGMRPTAVVKALSGDAVVVTGGVPDVRPFLQHAAVAVAPLRVARGIQNKVLEAMAMARPVVTSPACAGAIEGVTGAELFVADDADEYIERISFLLAEPDRCEAMAAAARCLVADLYSWERRLSGIKRFLPAQQPHHHFVSRENSATAVSLR